MEKTVQVQTENMKLLMEILNLKVNLEEIYNQKGPVTPDYISLSIKLDLLTKKYFEEKIVSLIHASKDELLDICEQNGLRHVETMLANENLDELIVKYQKLKRIS